ncbi:hypothetical protein XM38_004240 [Halomicronema hongdechloris C2206]|uniref:Uncharacterized protein n=1 Tax=Halomicronema hongdechloris C2206 TaxID=1641165 RepID=A0A1Z3HH18_9CYAN|nr:hypothetical protein XM38_004240 [Halomicronema hongdechloris C2206]
MSNLLSSVPKRKRVLVEVVEDGCAKTFIYKDVEDSEKSPKRPFRLWFSRKKRKKGKTD